MAYTGLLPVIQVCGTDGETYSNICELRTKSANARVDHRGECDEETDEMVDNRCMRLRRSGRCAAHANCRSRVRPGDGCCPICGRYRVDIYDTRWVIYFRHIYFLIIPLNSQLLVSKTSNKHVMFIPFILHRWGSYYRCRPRCS